MIPKIIHLCWLSGDPYPRKIQDCLDSWKKHLPSYEIILWDTKRFNIHEVPWVEQAFNTKKYAFAADYIRLYALYHHGGIYLDSDVEILKSLDNFLELPYFVGAETSGTIEAAILGAEKGCDWIKCCLDYYEGRNFIREDGSYDIRMLPEILNETILRLKPVINMPSGKIGLLSSMFTEPDYRRMGIAKELLHRVIEEARKYGCGSIQITASDMGVKLYKAYGFVHNGNFMQYKL